MSEGELFAIAGLTLRVGALATLGVMPFAIGVAWCLVRLEFPGKTLVRALVGLPMVLPPVAVGLALLWLLGRRGPLGAIWETLGVDLAFSAWAVGLAAALVGFPLAARACEQAFAAVDRRYETVAQTLGVTPFATFWRISLPLARRGVLYGALLCFTRGIGEFGATAVVAGIIPGRTETLSLGIWSRVQLGEDGSALALCAVSFAIGLATMWIGERWLARETP
ncbi:MAG: molybdate ABC transporter permease subunit [Deltaproteobacteria bacterium]|nr:molybdate ABC transporter permease subunit [Deltaproteobacteria bacterium]MBW2360884.1 molybdate ABC transporter permease subunit [Deltaproteobacteria bacterium]